jgi:hypothetical protein
VFTEEWRMVRGELMDGDLIKASEGFAMVTRRVFPYITPRTAAQVIELADQQARILSTLPLDDRGFAGEAEYSPEIAATLVALHRECAELLRHDLSEYPRTTEVQTLLADVTAYLESTRGIVARG